MGGMGGAGEGVEEGISSGNGFNPSFRGMTAIIIYESHDNVSGAYRQHVLIACRFCGSYEIHIIRTLGFIFRCNGKVGSNTEQCIQEWTLYHIGV